MPGIPPAASRALLSVGKGGRGFVIETSQCRLVLTAAHCLPAMPEPQPWTNESCIWRLLAPLGKKPSVGAVGFARRKPCRARRASRRLASRKRKYFRTNCPSRPRSGPLQTRHAISIISAPTPS